jgi:hypothetical protein
MCVVVGTLVVSALVLLFVGVVSGILSQVPIIQSVALLASAAFGATVKGSFTSIGTYQFSNSGLFIPWIALPGVVAYFVSKRIGFARSDNDVRRRSFIVKSAILTSFGSILVASLSSISTTMAIDSVGDVEARFNPSASRGFFVTLLTVSIGCAMVRGVFVSRSMVPEALANIRQFIPAALGAQLLLAATSLILGLGWIAISSDLSVTTVITFAPLLAILGINAASGISDFTMGVPIRFEGRYSSEENSTSISDSFHLLSASTDRWVVLLAVFAPLSVAVFTWRWLQTKNPSTQREISRAAATIGFLFGIFAAVFSLFASATSYASGYLGVFDVSFNLKVSSHFGMAFFLGCLWGLVGAYGAAFYWGSQRGIKLITTADLGTDKSV